MKDVNTILQQKIYDLIKPPVVPCPVFYKYIPAYVQDASYVTINTVTNIDASTMHSSDTDTTVVISIYSRDSQANPGQLVNDIAAAIYAVIYPDRQTKIDLSPEFQMLSVSLVNDVVPDAILTNNFLLINRFLTFRFNIFHR